MHVKATEAYTAQATPVAHFEKERVVSSPSLAEPAFPSDGNLGLTMRDYFAAAALTGILAVHRAGGGLTSTQAAQFAFAAADAMLAQRLRP